MTLQPPQPSRHRNTDSEERNYHQIRVRQDTNENWLKNNPIPASGEWCYSIGHRNPPTTYTLYNLPPATEELKGTFILVANEGENYVYECVLGLRNSGYVWRPRSIDYVEPEQADQCVKIGDGNTRWSELAWLGGRGQQGQTGIQGPEGPQGVDGTGSIAYRTIEIVALDAQTEFILPVSVQATSSFVTINGVVLSPSTYTLQVLKLTLATGIDTKAGDNVSIFTWIGAVDFEVLGLTTADVRTLGERPDYVKAVAKDDIENQQEVNWFLFDEIARLESGGGSLNTSDIQITSDDRPQKYEDLNLQNQQDVNWYLMDKIDDVDLSKYAETTYVDAQDNTKLGNSGEQVLKSSNWKVRAPKSEEGQNGNLSFIDIKEDMLHLYHLSDPKDPRHPAPLEYIQENYAGKEANNELTGTNTFKGLTHFEGSIISKADTVLELKGDPETPQHRFLKVRGNAQFSMYAYPGDNNDNARNAFSILMKPGDNYPVTTLNYLQDPVSNGHAVSLRYANANYAKKDQTLSPIVFKSAQGCKPTDLTSPTAGKAAFMNAPELGGQKNSNKYFGNCNNGIRIHKDSLKNAAGAIFGSGESYDVSGFVTVYGKENNKLYLKAPVVKVSRVNDFIDVAFTHSGWAPAINYGRGDTTEQSEFIILVEALGVDESGGQRAALERLKK